jgi:hypothetical protein
MYHLTEVFIIFRRVYITSISLKSLLQKARRFPIVNLVKKLSITERQQNTWQMKMFAQ